MSLTLNGFTMVEAQCDVCCMDFQIAKGCEGPWLTLCDECQAAVEDAAERMSR